MRDKLWVWFNKLLPVNMARIDQGLRLTTGVALFGLDIVGPQSVLSLVGLALIVTGATARCPLYRPFGFSTVEADLP